MSTLYERVQTAAEFVRPHLSRSPEVGIVLGSGMGEIADRIERARVIPYADIPGFPAATVAGHAGELYSGTLAGAAVLAMRGRFHYYEGHDLASVTLPIRVLAALGARVLIITAATGAIRADLRPGDLVCLNDHINMLGDHPLRGVDDERLGRRFVDLSEVYSKRLRALANHCAAGRGFALSEGIYAAMPGPSYETPAEIRMLGTLGADVVGMSTVPEAIVARQAGLEVLGLALVTNTAAGLGSGEITHDEVMEVGRTAETRVADLIEDFLASCVAKGAGG